MRHKHIDFFLYQPERPPKSENNEKIAIDK